MAEEEEEVNDNLLRSPHTSRLFTSCPICLIQVIILVELTGLPNPDVIHDCRGTCAVLVSSPTVIIASDYITGDNSCEMNAGPAHTIVTGSLLENASM